MIIRCFERAREFAEFDPETGTLNCFEKEGAGMELFRGRMQGRYVWLQDKLLVFYRKDGSLHLRIAGRDYFLDGEIESRLQKNRVDGVVQAFPQKLCAAASRLAGDCRKFDLTKNGTVIVSLKYRSPIESVLPFDFTPFIEDEDFDFLLFVHNVLSDPQRRRDIWA